EITIDIPTATRFVFFLDHQVGIRRLTTLAPQTDAFLPSLQRFLAVTAVVEFNVAVQAHVHEVTGEVYQVGTASSGIGYYQCHTMAAQQVDKGFIDKAVVADLYCMAQMLTAGNLQITFPLHTGIAAPRMGFCRIAGHWQLCEKFFKKGFIEFKTRRKLPQEGPEFFFKVEHATGKKIRQWLFNIAQTLDVRNVA